MKSANILMMILTLSALNVAGCGGGGGRNGNGNSGEQVDVSYNPVIDPANFVAVINNSYFPLIPGTTYLYHLTGTDGPDQDITVTVTHQTKTILGVTCIVVHDTATANGQMVEDTLDWYAQDKQGNVWYFGEDTKRYENGRVASTEGSWEAGMNDAKPGIVMEGQPKVGDTYRQEYAPGVAEDRAEVLGLDESVTVPY